MQYMRIAVLLVVSLAAGAPAAGVQTAGAPASRAGQPPIDFAPTRADERFLEDLSRTAVRFFVEQADARTGLVLDRARADGNEKRTVASIAATGFGLTALCIAAERGYMPRAQAQARALAALRFLWEKMPHEHGFFYHFVDMRTGERVWQCELSSIDTSILLCGVLMCGEYFDDPEVSSLARKIYERVDWPWMMNGGPTMSMGWKPESGFLESRWKHYCELMMIYLLGVGSPTHPLPPETWDAWERPIVQYGAFRFIGAADPLFVHQYSHAWFDFRGVRDKYADYFENSVTATRAHQLFCLRQRDRFPLFSEELWGITASDSAKGYVAWGGPPEHGPLDGTLVPAAPAGSLPFLPRDTIHTLRVMKQRFGHRIWKRYGFVDAFNPHTGWVNPDVIGIDVGISLLMAENLRTELVWRVFMKNADMRRAMELVGFRSKEKASSAATTELRTRGERVPEPPSWSLPGARLFRSRLQAACPG